MGERQGKNSSVVEGGSVRQKIAQVEYKMVGKKQVKMKFEGLEIPLEQVAVHSEMKMMISRVLSAIGRNR